MPKKALAKKCMVLFNYKPNNEDELELQVGDVITVLSEVEEGWWRGKLKDKIGVFPSNFVAEIDKDEKEAAQRKPKLSLDETAKASVPAQEPSKTNHESTPELPTLPPKPVKEQCKAIFNYEASNVDELSLQEGDIITIITKDGQDPGWWKGELKGQIGVFPDNFVQIIVPAEAKLDKVSKVSTNKTRDISKSATSSAVSSITSICRKFSDTSKDDKLSHPSLGKKPTVPPPPMKKPQRSSSDLTKSPTAPNLLTSKLLDISPTSSSSKQENIKNISTSSHSSNKWSVVEAQDNLDGAMWSKQGSYSLTTMTSSLESNLVSINSVPGPEQPDLDTIGRAAMLTHPTASRAKAPKRRPPSSIISKDEFNGEIETEEKNVSSVTTSMSQTFISSSVKSNTTLVNGDKESLDKQKAPWVKELELSQAKKSLQAGKTRVMIGGDIQITSVATATVTTSTTSISATETVKPSVTGVTYRTVTPSVGQRPQSMISSLRSPTQSAEPGTITIPIKQFNDLVEKVSKLEQTVKDLTLKYEMEAMRRETMQNEIDKLSDLVTQV